MASSAIQGSIPHPFGVHRTFTLDTTTLVASAVKTISLDVEDIKKFGAFNKFICVNRSGQLLSVRLNNDTTNVYYVPPGSTRIEELEGEFVDIRVKNESSSANMDTESYLEVMKYKNCCR